MRTAPFNATLPTKEVALILVPVNPADAAVTLISPRPVTAPPKQSSVYISITVPGVTLNSGSLLPKKNENSSFLGLSETMLRFDNLVAHS